MVDVIAAFNLDDDKEDVAVGKDVVSTLIQEEVLSASQEFRSLPSNINEGIQPATKFKSLGSIYPLNQRGGVNNFHPSSVIQGEDIRRSTEEIDVNVHSLGKLIGDWHNINLKNYDDNAFIAGIVIKVKKKVTLESYDFFFTTIGPFLDLLFEKIELMPTNSLATNLLVTGVISQLTSYPQPLLRSVMLHPDLILQPSIRGLFTAIASLRLIYETYNSAHIVKLQQGLFRNYTYTFRNNAFNLFN